MRKYIELTGVLLFFIGLFVAFAVFFVQTTDIKGEWHLASVNDEVISADFRLVASNGIVSGFEAEGELEITRNEKTEIFVPVAAQKKGDAFEIKLSSESNEIRAVFSPSLREAVVYYDDMNRFAGPADCVSEAEKILEALGA